MMGAGIPADSSAARALPVLLGVSAFLCLGFLGAGAARAQQWRITQVDTLRLDAKDLAALQQLRDQAQDLALKAADLTHQAAAETKIIQAVDLEIQARAAHDQYQAALKTIDQKTDEMAAAKMAKMTKELTDRCRTPFQARSLAISILARRSLYLNRSPKLAAAMSKAAANLQSWAKKQADKEIQKLKDQDKQKESEAKAQEEKKKKQQNQRR